jgi:signal peptidase I
MIRGFFHLTRLRRFARDLGLAFLACFFTLVFLFQPYKVEGSSMLPALLDQERILVHKWVHDPQTVRRGDIIVFHSPMNPTKSFIKRVIGVPGDLVALSGGQLMVNGRYRADLAGPPVPGETSFGPHRISAGHYFVLGDHRSISSDSRHWGLVSYQAIQGKAVLRYWPPYSFGFLS